MLRRVLSTFTILLLGAQQAFSVGVIATNLGNPIISPSQIQQSVNVKYSSSGQTTLSVRALDDSVANLTNPNAKSIPIGHVFITNGSGKHQLGANMPVELINAVRSPAMVEQNENISIRIENIGALAAGTYSTRLEFNNSIGSEGAALNYTEGFMLNITIPKMLDLSSKSQGPRIAISQENALRNSVETINNTPTQLDVKANLPWKMYLDTTGIGTLRGKYYFRVKNVTGNAKTDIMGQKIQLKEGQRYPIATGTQTSGNPPYGQYIPTNVLIEYSCQNEGPGFMKAGQYINSLQYALEEN